MEWKILFLISFVGLLLGFSFQLNQQMAQLHWTETDSGFMWDFTALSEGLQGTGMASRLYPALFICHGDGPMPLIDHLVRRPLTKKWRESAENIVARHGKPSAIAVVSAHYQTHTPEVGGDPAPAMLYDYGGFPPESYTVQYPAPGNASLAEEMAAAMREAGLVAQVDPKRRYDHGVFVPLMIMFPKADIPVIPVSVLRSDDPAEHIKMGQALRPFRERGVFFLGSGSSMHNFSNFRKHDAGKRFGDALTAVLQSNKTPEERLSEMRKVEGFDGFSEAHPEDAHEHLMPLLTLLGTANGTAAKEVASIPFGKANVRYYLFEG